MKNEYIKEGGIRDVVVENLKIIPANGGPVLHMLKQDASFKTFFPNGIGEIYFSEVEPGAVKAWKLHKKQNSLFAVPMGLIKIVLYDARAASTTIGVMTALDLGRPDDYRLLRVPCGIWYGFKCMGATPALICNCADIPHDPNDCLRKAPDDPDIPFQWD